LLDNPKKIERLGLLSQPLSSPNFIGKNDLSLGKNMVKWIRCSGEGRTFSSD